MARDLLNDSTWDLAIRNGDFDSGESELQETAVIIKLNQGNLRQDPILGPNLVTIIRGPITRLELEQRIALHLKRDGKDWKTIKNQVKINE